MHLYILAENSVKDSYTNVDRNPSDAGLDLYSPANVVVPANARGFKLPLAISCKAEINGKPTAYYLYARSSTGTKTPLRLSNTVGIIDSGYRGTIIAAVDNVTDKDFTVNTGDRYFQLCAPNLENITFELVDSLDETDRGSGGFGSTGN